MKALSNQIASNKNISIFEFVTKEIKATMYILQITVIQLENIDAIYQ
jgi:hypothetical protein